MSNNDFQQFLHHSSVGETVDVATPDARKLTSLGLWWGALTLFPLAVITFSVFDALSSDDPLIGSHNLVTTAGLLLMPLLAWFSIGNAVQRFQSSTSTKRYFRAGPGGVSVRRPHVYSLMTGRSESLTRVRLSLTGV